MTQPWQVQGPPPQHGRPSKEQVRQWMLSRIGKREPLPSPDQIRQMLGWSGQAG